MKLDYSLTSPKERLQYIQELFTTLPANQLDGKNLTFMSDYLLFVADKNQTKKEKKEQYSITTKNREVTINKRQVSFEELTSTLKNGEDGLYSMIRNDKNQILDQKDPITKKDIEEIPGLKENMEAITALKKQFERASGKNKFSLKQQIISKYQEQYILKASFRGGVNKAAPNGQIKTMAHMKIDEEIYLDEEGFPHSTGLINLFQPAHISFLLCYYSILKQECIDDFDSDMYYLLLDLEDLVEETLKDEPILYDLLIWKVDGITNEQIQKQMYWKYGIQHNEQYFSTLWRKRIPKMLVEKAQKKWLLWYYTNEEYGEWKKCGKCGQTKLAHPLFFSKNTSKDGFYSICKDCRSKRVKGE